MEILSWISDVKLFGINLMNNSNFYELLIRFSFNTVVTVFIIVRYLYYSITKRKDYLFTYILISIVVFFLCFLLGNVKLQLAFALGLFAIFGIIRYRTIVVPIKEMTYLFIVIGVSVINALANKKVSYAELVFTNLAVVTATFLLEKIWLLRHESSKVIVYEKIENIKPENHAVLKADLENRTGLKLEKIEIGRINFLNDTVRIRIYYFENELNPSTREVTKTGGATIGYPQIHEEIIRAFVA
jgi:hypothetical protein